MSSSGNTQPSLDRAEHIGADEGENIEAKRVGVYGYDSDNSQWRRLKTNTDGNLVSDGANYATQIDDYTTASVTYIGKAPIGSATSSAVWQIQRLDESTGLVKTWADGDASFNNIWDSRESLNYS